MLSNEADAPETRIMALVGWENPSYDTDLGPLALKWLKCQACAAQRAIFRCQLCSQQLCRDCEANAHAKLRDATAHLESLKPCNVCEDCRDQGPEFYCNDCKRYQCEGCCAASHSASERFRSHVWLCTEGALARQLRFGKCAPDFIQYVKMARRNAQLEREKQIAVKEEATALLPDFIPLPSVASADDDEGAATSDEEEALGNARSVPAQDAMEIKMEHVRLNGQADTPTSKPPTERDYNEAESAAAEMASVPEPVAVPVKSETRPEGMSQSVALDSAEATGRGHDETSLHKEREMEADAHVKSEATLQSAAEPLADDATKTHDTMKAEFVQDPDVVWTEPPPVAAEVVDLTGDDDDENFPPVHGNVKNEEPLWPRGVGGDFSLDSDPIRSQLAKAYNSQTKRIYEAHQHSARLTQRATNAAHFHDIQHCKQQLDALKATIAKATESRNATLARLLVYVKHSEPEFQKLLTESTLNMPDAETAIHRECARLQAEINEKGVMLQSCRAQVDEAIRMKPTESFTEVMRLGNEIASLEKTIQELEKMRLDQLGNLCYVSEAVRAAVRAMMGASTATSPSS